MGGYYEVDEGGSGHLAILHRRRSIVSTDSIGHLNYVPDPSMLTLGELTQHCERPSSCHVDWDSNLELVMIAIPISGERIRSIVQSPFPLLWPRAVLSVNSVSRRKCVT